MIALLLVLLLLVRAGIQGAIIWLLWNWLAIDVLKLELVHMDFWVACIAGILLSAIFGNSSD